MFSPPHSFLSPSSPRYFLDFANVTKKALDSGAIDLAFDTTRSLSPGYLATTPILTFHVRVLLKKTQSPGLGLGQDPLQGERLGRSGRSLGWRLAKRDRGNSGKQISIYHYTPRPWPSAARSPRPKPAWPSATGSIQFVSLHLEGQN